jgi:hypothetical protein
MPINPATSVSRKSTTVYPLTTSGVLWVGIICKDDFNATRRANEYPSVRIDDVSFTRIGACGAAGLSLGGDITITT